MSVQPGKAPDTGHSALAAAVTANMDRFSVPGVAVGVLQNGETWTVGFGVTNVDHPLPVTPDTLFQIGSITKTVTCTAVMRLVEQGLIDLEAPVRRYLPDLRLQDEDVAARVTMRHLLTHTAGWLGDYFDDTGRGDDALRRIVERMAALPQISPLGSVYSYCNSGFYLAGRVIELVTGEPYETAARRLVLEPLAMEQSFFLPEEVMTRRFGTGHLVVGGVPQVAEPWAVERSTNPLGGLISTVADLLRYARFHMDDGTTPTGDRLLSAESIRVMQTPQVRGFYPLDHVGLTWRLKRVGPVQTVSHGGATKGQQATFVMVPERGFALALLTNADQGGALGNEMTDWALEHYLGVKKPALTPLDVAPGDLVSYVGTYESPLSDRELSIQDGYLMLQLRPKGGFPSVDTPPGPTKPPVRMALWDEDRVVCLDDPMQGECGEFLRGPEGDVIAFHLGGRLSPRSAR